ECINRMLTLEPSLESDKEFKAFRKKAEKYRKKNTVLATPKGTTRPQKSNTPGLDLAKWIGPAVAILLVLGYFATAIWRGMSREVDVVNGLSIPYTATVNGQIVPLEPHSRRSITISEGQATVSGASDEVAIPERTITVKTPFWTRPFKQHRFVINPDEAAAIGRATIVYGDRNAEPQVTTSAGQFLYSYEGIDHPFEEPPQTIEVSNDGIGYRDILFLLSPDTEFVYLSRQEQVTILKNRLKFAKGARSIPIMRVLAELAEPEDFLNVATTFIAERPLLVEWHRVYQTISESARPDHDLISEYKAQLAQDPNNSDLLYLTARLHTDLRQRRELLKRALDVDPNSPYANHGLGYELLASGRFDRAMSYATTAWQADPSNTLFATLYYYCLIANENFDGAIEIIETSGLVDSVQTLVQTIPLLVAKGEAPTAADAINAFVKASYGETPSAQRDMLQNALQDVLDYAAGNFDDLNARYADELNNVEPSFQVLVSQGRLAEASDLLDANVMVLSGFEPSLFFPHLALYIAASSHNETALAARQLELAIELLATGDADDRQVADLLKNPEHAGDEPIVPMRWPGDSRLVAAALAKRIPKHQGQYRQLAEKLNFERTFPYWELKRDLERTTGFE
ncbi:MAG: tetratricopeptide repeat protein, partial [Planctomycetales bacterium]|nr:tetratricopeptide repeat protein [Planctomycetales bacterium]